MTSSSKWGELDEEGEDLDRIQEYLKHNFRENCLNVELPTLHQPTQPSKSTKDKKRVQSLSHVLLPPKDSANQNYMLHSIELQHHKRKMRYMLAAAYSHQQEMMKGSSEGSSLPSPPPPPKKFCANDGRLKDKTGSQAAHPSFLDLLDNLGSNPSNLKRLEETYVEVDPLVNRQLLLKSVAAVCAHSGFENALDVGLQTLTDVVSDYIQNLCVLFKRTHDRSPRRGNSDQMLADLEHSLQELGVDSLLLLQQHWVSRVGQVTAKFEQDDIDLVKEYNSLKETSSSQRTVCKEEKSS